MGSNRVLNGDPSTASTFQRPLFIGRNTPRAPHVGFAVRYTRLFPIRERMKLEFIAESTNIFNRTNVVRTGTTPQPWMRRTASSPGPRWPGQRLLISA